MISANGIVQFRRLPGIAKETSRFCVHPDGNIAFIFDLEEDCFLQVNLDDRQTCRIKTESTKQIVGEEIWCDFRAVIRNSQTFILALILEDETKKYYAISYCISDRKCSVIHEHYLGAKKIDELQIEYLTNDEKEQIYFISRLRSNSVEEVNTVFDVVKINLDDKGTITSQIMKNKHTFNGAWFRPFVRSDSINWIQWNAGKNEHILTMPFSTENATEIQFTNDDVDKWASSEGVTWSLPITVGDHIFYYLLNKQRKLGCIVYCDWIFKRWKQLQFDMNEHVLIKWALLEHSKDGRIYLRGQCSLESCEEKFHIYVIEMKTDSTQAIDTEHQQNNAAAHLVPTAKESPRANDRFKIEPLSTIKLTAENQPKSQWTPVDYIKEEKLGSGQFGVVYKCWDKERRRYFVAKYNILQSDENKEVAENEVKRLKGLSHHKIIEYYGCKSEDNILVIFMEYMPLGSIRQLIDKHGAISEKTAIIYTGQILEGLAYVHDKGIVHSDLKCDNLLSDQNGNVKIGDFGIAVQRILRADKSYINAKSLGRGGGTLLWMAPEVFETNQVSRASDMWSLGITIVEMLTTNPPYIEMSPFQFLMAIGQKKLKYDVNDLVASKLSEPLVLLLSKMLQIDPSERLKTGKEAAEMFQSLCSKRWPCEKSGT